MVAIKKFTNYMSITTKTMTKFLKTSLKRQFLLLFQDDKKEDKSLIFAFPLKIEDF